MAKQVIYSNYLNTVGLKDFKENELNLFFLLLKELNYRGEMEVTIPYSYIKKELDLTHVKSFRITKLLKSMLSKLIKITFVREQVSGSGKLDYLEYTIFNKYHIKEADNLLIIRATLEAIPLLNDLLRNFTKMDLSIYFKLKTKYSKELYRHLKQFDRTRIWRINVDDFHNFLSIPKAYDFGTSSRRVIAPSIEEIKTYYPDLRVNYIYEKKTGERGRPKVKMLEFLYSKPKENQVTKEVDLETGEIIEKEDLSINLSLEKKKELLLKLQQEILLEENNGDYPEWVTEDTKKIFNKTYSKV